MVTEIQARHLQQIPTEYGVMVVLNVPHVFIANPWKALVGDLTFMEPEPAILRCRRSNDARGWVLAVVWDVYGDEAARAAQRSVIHAALNGIFRHHVDRIAPLDLQELEDGVEMRQQALEWK